MQGVESNIDLMHAATAIIDDGKKQLLGDGVVMSAAQKKKMIESFYGCEVPSVIEVHPPQLVSTKGSGSRLISRREKAIRMMSKPGRRCAKCGEVGHHDSRNCKNAEGKNKITE